MFSATSMAYGTGVAPFWVAQPGLVVEQNALQSSPFQLFRELVQNGFDAIDALRTGSGRVTVGIRPVMFDSQLLHKLAVIDSGVGFTRTELGRVTNGVTASGKTKTSGPRDRHGQGLKHTMVRTSPFGLVFKSWRNGRGYMAVLRYDPDTGEGGLMDLSNDGSGTTVIPVPAADKPEEINTHGTVVYVLGHSADDDTALPPDGSPHRPGWLVEELTKRYISIPDGVELVVENLRPANAKPAKRAPARNTVVGIGAELEKLADHYGEVTLSDATAHYWVLPEKGAVSRKFSVAGHVGALFQDEIYGRKDKGRNGTTVLQSFGLVSSHNRVVIYIRPEDEHRYVPNVSRSAISEGSEELPWDRWSREFKQVMPDCLKELERAERRDWSGRVQQALDNIVAKDPDLFSVPRTFQLTDVGRDRTLRQPPFAAQPAPNEPTDAEHAPGDLNDPDRSAAAGQDPGRSGGDTILVSYFDDDGETHASRRREVVQTPEVHHTTEQDDPSLEGVAARYIPEAAVLQINDTYQGALDDIERLTDRLGVQSDLDCEQARAAYLSTVELTLLVVVMKNVARFANKKKGFNTATFEERTSPAALSSVMDNLPWVDKQAAWAARTT